jgi:hypothetical protein
VAIHRRAAVLVLAAIVAATTLIATAGAGATSGTVRRLEVSSVPAAKRYLRSLGIDPAGFVVQRSQRNYAGPDCPGRSWSCTTAKQVIQIAGHGGQNTFVCDPASDGTNQAANTCVSSQSSASGNTARCVIKSEAPTIQATCRITQTSQHGDNRAFIEMVARQSDDMQQKAVLNAVVAQTSVSGTNSLHSSQKGEQDTKRHGGTVAQAQEGKLSLVVDQTSSSGKQDVQMHQSLDQDAKAEGPVLGGSQSQLGDLIGDIDQTSAGRSESHARQDEDQDAKAPKGSSVVQTQSGPLECCTQQLGNAGNRFDINQNASQSASQEAASQLEVVNGSCISSGNCDVDQQAQNNVDRAKNSCNGHVCFIFIVCRSGENAAKKSFFVSPLHEAGCTTGSKKHH